MARITPSSGFVQVDLEDHTPYTAEIVSFDFENGTYKGKERRQLIIDWKIQELDEDVPTVRDWVPISLNNRRDNGGPSQLKQLLNAVSGRDKNASFHWFDDETAEFAWDDETSKLTEGMTVVLGGETVERQEGEGTRFNINWYRRPKPETNNGTAKKAKPATASVDPDDVPF